MQMEKNADVKKLRMHMPVRTSLVAFQFKIDNYKSYVVNVNLNKMKIL